MIQFVANGQITDSVIPREFFSMKDSLQSTGFKTSGFNPEISTL